MSRRIVVAGSVAQRPGQGGHTWLFLQYVLGLQRLGWDVLLLDRLEPAMCHDASGRPCAFEASANLAYWRAVIEAFDLGPCASLRYNRGEHVVGVQPRQVREFAGRSAGLLNVMGFLDDDDVLSAVPMRVFVDIDPGFTQMWQQLGQTSFLGGHDAFVTVGANVGAATCAIPTCDRTWIPWRPPVVLDQWTTDTGPGSRPFTSVGAWRGPYAPVEYDGHVYGLRAHEFRKFAALPLRTDARFEVALDIDSEDRRDKQLLEANGWALADPAVVARDPWAYRDYVRASRAEFQVAKGIYVHTRSGWFSDRSACYLAAGRPVVAQDTGWAGHVATDEGLLTYQTFDEACAVVEAVTGDYDRHAHAARALAAECFDSDKVLRDLLSQLGVE